MRRRGEKPLQQRGSCSRRFFVFYRDHMTRAIALSRSTRTRRRRVVSPQLISGGKDEAGGFSAPWHELKADELGAVQQRLNVGNLKEAKLRRLNIASVSSKTTTTYETPHTKRRRRQAHGRENIRKYQQRREIDDGRPSQRTDQREGDDRKASATRRRQTTECDDERANDKRREGERTGSWKLLEKEEVKLRRPIREQSPRRPQPPRHDDNPRGATSPHALSNPRRRLQRPTAPPLLPLHSATYPSPSSLHRLHQHHTHPLSTLHTQHSRAVHLTHPNSQHGTHAQHAPCVPPFLHEHSPDRHCRAARLHTIRVRPV